MGQFSVRSREAILQRMVARVVARTDLNDLNVGSDIRQVLAAAADADSDANFQMVNLQSLFDIKTAIGNDLDEAARRYNPRLVTRNTARRATGTVTFSRAGTSGAVTIPIGTQVTRPEVGGEPEVVFETTAEGTIADGFSTSGAVGVRAVETGEGSNVDPGVIKGFLSKPTGVDSVTNASAITNGRNRESDASFRNRIIVQIRGLARCHPAGIEAGALLANDPTTDTSVLFANVVEDKLSPGNVTVYIDDGAGTVETAPNAPVSVTAEVVLNPAVGGETVLYTANKPLKIESGFVLRINAVVQTQGLDYSIDPASGQINLLPANYPAGLTAGDNVQADYTYFTGLIAAAQKIIDGDPADRANFPGYRGAGVLVRVLSPTINQIVVSLNITVASGFSTSSVATQVAAAISGYINGLSIGEDVILNELRERAMAVPGMFDVEFFSPTSNTVVLENALARIIDSNLTVT